MATPHLAGGVALLWQEDPALVGDVDATETRFTENAVRMRTGQRCGGIPGRRIPNNTFGWGLVDLLAAVQAP